MQITTVSEHAGPLIVGGGVDACGRNRHAPAATARRGHDVTVRTRPGSPHTGPAMPTGAGAVTGPSPSSPALPCRDAIGIRSDAFVMTRKTRPPLMHGRCRVPGSR